MIPYVTFNSIMLGPLTIHVWGLLVALGFLVGGWAGAAMVKKRGMDPKVLWDLLGWIVLASMIMARVFHVVFYEPTYYLANPFEVFAIWHGGLSMMGGLVGAVLISVWYLRRRKMDVLKFADAAVFGLPLGYAIGRLGCFLIHDHPGTATDFFLGVQYPDGIVRHDLGLYHSIDGAVLFLVFLVLSRRKLPTGVYVVVAMAWYGTTRFFLDFLRATDGAIVDVRYFGLTAAQYISVFLILFSIVLYRRILQAKN